MQCSSKTQDGMPNVPHASCVKYGKGSVVTPSCFKKTIQLHSCGQLQTLHFYI